VSDPNLLQPLTDADIDQLDLLLSRVSPEAMAVDELDGFFCALVCGPSDEPLEVYFLDAVGVDLQDEKAVGPLVDPRELLTLLHRRWNEIAAELLTDKPHIPLFATDPEGHPDGHDWAAGFAQGMDWDSEEWDRLVKDKSHWMDVAPIMLLLAVDDPEMVSELGICQPQPEDQLQFLADPRQRSSKCSCSSTALSDSNAARCIRLLAPRSKGCSTLSCRVVLW
jgi:uncharacterized protein